MSWNVTKEACAIRMTTSSILKTRCHANASDPFRRKVTAAMCRPWQRKSSVSLLKRRENQSCESPFQRMGSELYITGCETTTEIGLSEGELTICSPRCWNCADEQVC